MICPGSGRHTPVTAAATPHRYAVGYCPHCARAHALTRQGRVWRHRITTEPLTRQDQP